MSVSLSLLGSETIVRDKVHNGEAYRVVETEFDGKEKGIYVRKKGSKDWHLALKGDVLFYYQAKGPIVAQFDQYSSGYSQSYEMISIIDGELVLYNFQSDSNEKNSYIRIGVDRNQLYDPLSRDLISLQKITDAENVSAFVSTLSSSGQEFVISVKFDSPQMVGDGVTFVANLETSETGQLKLTSSPVILNYKYMNDTELKKISPINSKYISERVLNKIINNETLKEKASKEIREQLIRAKNLGPMSQAVDPKKLPMWDIQTNDIHLPVKEISKEYGIRDGKIVYIYGISGSPNRVKIFNSKDNLIEEIVGDLEILSEKDFGARIFHHEEISLVPINNKLYVISPSQGVVHQIKIPGIDEMSNIQELNFFYQKSGGQYTMVLSMIYNNIPRNHFLQFVLSNSHNNLNFLVKKSYTIPELIKNKLSNFYSHDLKYRFHQSEDGGFLFDNITSPQNTKSAYDQQLNKDLPMINLLTSKDEGPNSNIKIGYIRPKNSIRINEYLIYKEYADDSLTERLTAVYSTNDDFKFNAKKLPGELIFLDADKKRFLQDTSSFVVELNDPNAKGTNSKVRANVFGDVFALDSTYKKGEQGYTLYFTLAIKSDKETRISPAVIELPKEYKLSDIEFIKILNHKDRKFTDMSLIVSYGKTNEYGEKNDWKIYSFPVKFEVDAKDKSVFMKQLDPVLISDLYIEENHLMERVKFDQNGKSYWIENPNIIDTDKKFIVKSLRTGKILYPNLSDEDKKLQLNSISESEKSKIFNQKYERLRNYLIPKFNPQLNDKAPTHFKNISYYGHEKYKSDLFPGIRDLLETLASAEVNGQDHILIVPAKLKEYLQTVIYSIWQSSKGKFSIKNNQLDLYYFGDENTQTESQTSFIELMKGIVEQSKKKRMKSIVLGDLTTLEQFYNRFTDEQDPQIRLQDEIGFNSDEISALTGDEEVKIKNVLPHALYLLKTEGEEIPLKEMREYFSEEERTFSTLFIATPEEWKSYENDVMKTEVKHGFFESFHVREIQPPTFEKQVEMILSIFERETIEEIDYKYNLKGLVNKEHLKKWEENSYIEKQKVKRKIAEYFVNRINDLSRDSNDNAIEKFTVILKTIGQLMISSEKLRKRRVIDKSFVEGILYNEFDIPLNEDVLPSDDPLVRVLSENFMQDLLSTQYTASADLAGKIIDRLRAQTRKDPTRPVSASFILMGPTGRGKTSLVLAFFEALKLKVYDLSDNHHATNINRDAQAFIIKGGEAGQVSYGGNSYANNSINIDRILEHLDNFLASENGPRGFILVDDIHKMDPVARGKVIKRLHTLIEPENGKYTARPIGDDQKPVTRPVRNLSIFLTLNGTEEDEKIRKVVGNKKEPDFYDIAIATLNHEDSPIDKSFFKRFSEPLYIGEFNPQAKAPKIMVDVNTAVKEEFTNNGRYLFVSPFVIEGIVKDTADYDARTFLSGATNALLDKWASYEGTSNSAKIIAPLLKNKRKSDYDVNAGLKYVNRNDGSESMLKNLVEKTSETLSVESTEGRLRLLEYIVDSLRFNIFNALYEGISISTDIVGNEILQKNIYAPALEGIYEHITNREYLPITELMIEASQFGLEGASEKKYFKEYLQNFSSVREQYFPEGIFVIPEQDYLQQITNLDYQPVHQRTRADVINEYKAMMDQRIRKFANYLLRISDEKGFNFEKWLKELPTYTTDSIAYKYNEFKKAITADYVQFSRDIKKTDLQENRRGIEYQLTTTEEMSTFLYILDKSLSHLKWANYINIVSSIITNATGDMSIGHNVSLKDFLFKDKKTLFSPVAHESLENRIQAVSLFEYDLQKIKKLEITKKLFEKCEKVLRGGND